MSARDWRKDLLAQTKRAAQDFARGFDRAMVGRSSPVFLDQIERVHCYREGDPVAHVAMRARDGTRWKCALCDRGVVVLMIQDIPDVRGACRCCGALVEAIFRSGRRIYSAGILRKPVIAVPNLDSPKEIRMEARLPFQPGSPESLAAAESKTFDAKTERDRVLNLLRTTHLSLSDEQIQLTLNMPANTERPRRVELVRMGLVEKTSLRARTASGRWAGTWRAV